MGVSAVGIPGCFYPGPRGDAAVDPGIVKPGTQFLLVGK